MATPVTRITVVPGYTAGAWRIDPEHSHVGFIVRHLMVSKVRGRFASFAGQITTAADIFESSVTVTIDMASIDTGSEMRDEHLRSAEFFDAENHPSMSYRSTGIREEEGAYLVDGELTLRGVTRPVTLTVETPAFGQHPQGGARAGFSATAEINRMDFGVSYNGPVPGGGMALSERVQIVLEVEAELLDGGPRDDS